MKIIYERQLTDFAINCVNTGLTFEFIQQLLQIYAWHKHQEFTIFVGKSLQVHCKSAAENIDSIDIIGYLYCVIWITIFMWLKDRCLMELQIMSSHLTKFTSVYLRKFFKKKNLPYEEWEINIDGVKHIVGNNHVIDMILNAQPSEQEMIAETLLDLESQGLDLNVFLKYLAFESNLFTSHISH